MTSTEMLELRRWMSDLANSQGETASRIEQVWKDDQAYHAALLDDWKRCHEELTHVRAELRIIRRHQRAVRRKLQQEKEAAKKGWLRWIAALGLVAYRGIVILVGGVVMMLGMLRPDQVLGLLKALERYMKGAP